MDIGITQQQGRVPVTVLQIKGDINAATYEQFQTRAQEAIQAGTRYLLLDLSGVRYMSSAGLRALTQIYNWLRPEMTPQADHAVSAGVNAGTFRSPNLKLLNPTPNVMQVLKIAGFDMFLDIYQDQKQAVESF